MKELTFEKNEFSYKISFNNISLGELGILDDGEYYWFPPCFNNTCVQTWVIEAIVSKLKVINESWN